ncbi:MAG: hypothetical protein R3F30_09165 [Planctomycetota bacterium]
MAAETDSEVHADMCSERIIRVAEIPEGTHPLGIISGDPPARLAARWAAIAIVPSSPPSYLLYLLGPSGAILEVLQFESMLIALDQAMAIVGIGGGGWSSCDVETPDGDLIDPGLFSRYLAG